MLIKEIAEKTGIGESTVRFYMNKFPEFMFYKMEGRRKQYSPETIEIIKFISDRYAEQWTAERIRDELEQKYNIILETNVQEEKDKNSPLSIPEQELLSALVAQNSMLMEKILGFEQRLTENAVEQHKNAVELRSDFQRISEHLNTEFRNTIAEERELYQNKINKLENQIKEQQRVIMERLEAREKIIQEAITSWREAATTAREEKKKPWWKFWNRTP